AEAAAAPLLPPGTHDGLTSCPSQSGDDEDWYRIQIGDEGQLAAQLTGGGATDLDLALTDDAGSVLTKSISSSSNESIAICLSPGTYYLRVYAWSSGENHYTLSYSTLPQS